MDDKEALLAQIREGLEQGTLKVEDIRAATVAGSHEGEVTRATQAGVPQQDQVFGSGAAAPVESVVSNEVQSGAPPEVIASQPESKKEDVGHASPIANVFYDIAGILLFAVLLSIVFQTLGKENFVLHLALTLGAGLVLWALTYVFRSRSGETGDVPEGIASALLATGSLSVLAGFFVALSHIGAQLDGSFNILILAALLMLAMSMLHFAADAVLKQAMLLSLAVMYGVGAVAILASYWLTEASASGTVWSIVIIAIAVWLAVKTRILARTLYRERLQPNVFDTLSLWTVLVTLYFSSYGTWGVAWLVVLAFAVLGVFYLSVVRQKKEFLGTAALFLVVTLVTISFRYFSDFGVTISLLMSVIAILGSAYVTSLLHKRYFKEIK